MTPFFKPHPHGFLLAADQLGVEPSECLVIGDQLFDIEGAKNAGMQSCLVRGSYTPKGTGNMSSHSVDTLHELLQLIHH
jgi:phosphoglycolate phosphatase